MKALLRLCEKRKELDHQKDLLIMKLDIPEICSIETNENINNLFVLIEKLESEITLLEKEVEEEKQTINSKIPYKVNWGKYNIPSEKIIEWSIMPSGRIVVMIDERGLESLWFDREGNNILLGTSIIWENQ